MALKSQVPGSTATRTWREAGVSLQKVGTCRAGAMAQPLPASQNSYSPPGICHSGCNSPPIGCSLSLRLAGAAFQVFVAPARQHSLHMATFRLPSLCSQDPAGAVPLCYVPGPGSCISSLMVEDRGDNLATGRDLELVPKL